MRKAGNRPGTRNAVRQATYRASGSQPEVQLRSIRYSGDIPRFNNIDEEDNKFFNTKDAAGVLRGNTPDIVSVPTPTSSK
jgi:hypothetical protein